MMCATIGQRDEFRAMGSAVQVEVIGSDEAKLARALAIARRLIADLEHDWSRFLPDSDISRLNAAEGAAVAVQPSTIDLLHAMVEGFAATDGCFDPTLLAPLVALGYDASWSDPRAVTSLPAGVAWRGDMTGIAVDAAASVALLPAGTVLDAGGIGKGLAADRVVAALMGAGVDGAMVSIGGDLRVVGVGPHQGAWVIGVADAFDQSDTPAEVTQLSLANAGVASSGTARRTWNDSNDTSVHHLLDPVTGRPLQNVVQVTAVAGTAAWAEVYAKLLMVRGAGGLAALDHLGLGACVVLADGSVHCNDVWRTLELQCIRN